MMNGAPVTRTVRELLLWMASHGKLGAPPLDVSTLILTDEDGQILDLLHTKLGDYRKKKVIVSRPAVSHRSLPPPPAPSRLARASTVRGTPSNPLPPHPSVSSPGSLNPSPASSQSPSPMARSVSPSSSATVSPRPMPTVPEASSQPSSTQPTPPLSPTSKEPKEGTRSRKGSKSQSQMPLADRSTGFQIGRSRKTLEEVATLISPPPPKVPSGGPSPRIVSFAEDAEAATQSQSESGVESSKASLARGGWSQGVVAASKPSTLSLPKLPGVLGERTSPMTSPRSTISESPEVSESESRPSSPRKDSSSTNSNKRASSRPSGIARVLSGKDPVGSAPNPNPIPSHPSHNRALSQNSSRAQNGFLLPIMSFESDGSVDEKKRGELNSFLFEFKGCQLLLVEEMRMRNDASSPEIHPYSSKKEDSSASKVEAAAGTSGKSAKIDKDALDYLTQLYDRMRDPTFGVETKSRNMKFSPFGSSKKFFMNKDLVDWLLKEDSKSRAEAVKIGEALQQCNVITPKTKGQVFADDDNYSKFNYPDEFVLSDTSALQNLFVHGTRNKMQQGGQALPPTRDPSQVLSPRASKAKLTKAEVEELKAERGRHHTPKDEGKLTDSGKRERSPVRKVHSSSRVTLSVHEHQLKINYETLPQSIVVPFATLDSILVRQIPSYEQPVLEFSLWDMRRYWIAPDASHNVNNSESAADYVCNRIADVVKKFHAAYLDFAPIDSQLLVYLNDPFLDFSTNDHPLTNVKSWWRVFSRKSRTAPGNFRDVIVPASLEDSQVAALMVAWNDSQFPHVDWAKGNSAKDASSPTAVIAKAARPNGFTDAVSQVRFAAVSPLLNPEQLVLSLDYLHTLHEAVNTTALKVCKIAVFDTGGTCAPLTEAFEDICTFQFLESPDADALKKIYSKLRRLSSPFMKSFGPYFYQVESSGYVDVMKHYLDAANAVADQVKTGASVLLIEGRSGTYNAAVIASLAQIILDSKYRTPEGFIALFCKEFLKFTLPTSQIFNGAWVEVFMLFSCVAHILQQNTDYFAFSKTFLAEVLNTIYQVGLHKSPNPITSFVKAISTSPSFTNTGKSGSKPTDGIITVTSHSPLPWFDYLLQFNSGVQNLRDILKSEFLSASSAKESTFRITGGVAFPDLLNSSITSISIPDGSFWTLPDSFSNLTSLTSLSLDGNRFSVIPPAIIRLPNLTSLSMMKNRLSTLPDMQDFVNLKSFTARLNQLSSIDGICSVKSLTSLQLEGNHLRSIPPSLKNLNNLTRLDLGANKLTHVSGKILAGLEKLQFLSLSGNQLIVAPSHLPASLTELHLEGNSITVLPASMFSCIHLKVFDASDNSLDSLPSEIGQLQELRFLNLRHNALEILPVELNKCRLLEDLALAKNRISVVPPWLYQLHALRRLDLESNRLTKVTSSIGQLKTLQVLNLANNLIDTIPLPLGLLYGTLQELDLRGNKFSHDVMVELEKGTTSFLAFLKGRLSEDYLLYRVNLMIVGPEKAGKSHLFTALCNHWDNEEQALRRPVHYEGVHVKGFMFDIAEEGRSAFKLPLPFFGSSQSSGVKLKKTRGDEAQLNRGVTKRTLTSADESSSLTTSTQSLKVTSNQNVIMSADSKRAKAVVTLWDFSGSSVFQALDRFFFVKSSIYLLVVNLKEANNIEANVTYWFNAVQSQVSHPTIILIGTRKDELPKDAKPNAIMDGLVKKLLTLDPKSSVYSILMSTSIEDDTPALLAQIQAAMAKFADFGRSVPAAHIFFEQLLKDYAETLDYPLITQQTLLRLGDACGLGKRKDILAVTKFLHNLGSILYFDEVSALKDVVFLDPLWLYGAMASAFGEDSSALRFGVANNAALSRLFRRFDPKLHAQLRTLLVKLEIAFEINGDVEALVALIQSSASQSNQSKTLYVLKKSGSLDSARPRKISLANPFDKSSSVPESAPNDPASQVGLLLPSHLPSEFPVTIVAESWKYPPKEPGYFHLDRIFVFDFLPPGLFPSILVRALKNIEAVKALWRNGVMGVYNLHGSSASVFIWQTFSKINLNQIDTVGGTHYNTIRLEVRGSDLAKLRDVFLMLLDTLTAIMSEFKRVVVHEYVLNPRSFTFPNFLVVPIHEIEVHIRRGLSKLPDESGTSAEVTFETLVPDLTMSFYRGNRERFEKFKITGDLGEGGFAFVKKADYSGKPVALKLIKLPEGGNVSLERTRALAEFRREIFAQSTFNHPNLVPIVAIVLDPLSVAIEVCKFGDLNKYLARHDSPYSWALALKIARDIGSGIRYMQSLSPPWAHLDIKTPNILLKSNNPADLACAMITDFGTASRSSQPFTVRFVDNPTWLAPEILLSMPYDHKADTYAYGVILWELITRAMYFGEITWDGEKQDRIAAGDRPAIPANCPPEYSRCIQMCWHQQPDQRPSLDEIVPVMDSLKSRAAEFDNSCPIPVPAPISDPSSPEAINKKPVPSAPEPERYVAFIIDPTLDGGDLSRAASAYKMVSSKIGIVQLKSLSEFNDWLAHDGARFTNRTKVVTGSLRKDDSLHKFVEEVVRGLESDSKKASIPILACVPNSGPYLHLRRKGVTFCHEVTDIRKYIEDASH